MFRFTIRDLLWLTVLAGVLVAWWMDRSRLEALLEYSIKKYEMQEYITGRGKRPPEVWSLEQR